MDPRLKEWVQENSQEECNGDFTTFVLQLRLVHEEKKVRILAFGPENDLEEKIVLLLGETGAGKTLFLNALLNRIYGVQLEDGLRLQLRDQMDERKKKVESQTDYITAYTFYHQEGMPHRYNYTIIDTPGLVDTRGATQDQLNEQCLRFYLISDQWLKHLNSVALVWKSSDNRLSEVKKEILGKIKALLGRDIKSITDILMTHTSRANKDALEVLREGQFDYREVFCCDSGCLYEIMEDEDDKEEREVDWKRMTKLLDKFLTSLHQREPVSLKITKELLRTTAKLTHVKEALISLGSQREELGKELETYQQEIDQLKQQALMVDWDKIRELDMSSREIHLDDGKHCHYCFKCEKVCNASCSNNHQDPFWPPYDDKNDGLLGKLSTTIKSASLKLSWQNVLQLLPFAFTRRPSISFIITAAGTMALISLKPSGLTLKLHEMEGRNKCPDCGHKGYDHDVRDKFLVKDATFDVQMELLKLERFREVMGTTADFETNVNECLEKMKEIDRKNREEVQRQMELETDMELLTYGFMM